MRYSLTYFASYVFSLLGNSIASIAIPLVVLQSTGSVLGAGTVAAATAVPAFLAGIFMGVVIDRINRRTSSVVTDLVSAASVAALPFIDLFTDLTVGIFVLFGVIGSLGDIPGQTAREALLPAIVAESGLSKERLLGIRESIGAAVLVVGPAIAGTLVALLEGSSVLWVTAGTSLVAALITLTIPRRLGAITTVAGTAAPRSAVHQFREGWLVLMRSRILILLTAISLVSAVVLTGLQGLVLPVHFTAVNQTAMLGFVLSSLAVGLLIGSGIYAALAKPEGRRAAWLRTGMVGATLGFILIATLHSTPLILIGAFVVGLASGLFGGLLGVLSLEHIPDALRGRVIGTQNALLSLAPAIGIMGAAALTEAWSLQGAVAVIAALWAVMTVVALVIMRPRDIAPVAAPDVAPDMPEADQRVAR
ncbi:MFS transporter [Ruania alba]|uniref:Multidrug efflux pump Tap n=1 Tax=Ruania alba TaxID=648782 RepID=A0A1H5LQ90_9MICO|nr:MFS transporter [Ruania alba]SEE78561.1 Predicted arabinose efflux permease, MFS family [Ruania alba]